MLQKKFLVFSKNFGYISLDISKHFENFIKTLQNFSEFPQIFSQKIG